MMHAAGRFIRDGAIILIISLVHCNVHSALGIRMSTSSRQQQRLRTFLITGATDGIGKHTSQKLASNGGSNRALLIHGRKSPSDEVVKSIVGDLERRGAARVAYLQADLADLDEVEMLAGKVTEQLRSWQSSSSESETSSEFDTPYLDVLVNNAGVFDPEPRHSAQGYDATMAINVLAPYVLTRKLLPSLARGDDVRIITTSSISQSRTLPNLNSLFARRINETTGECDATPLTYSAHSSYSHSKLGDLLFTAKLARVLSGYRDDSREGAQPLLEKIRKIQCLTMDPGTVNTKMLLAGWGPCGISVKDANNTYKLTIEREYAFGEVESGSYHFGWGVSRDANDEVTLQKFWGKLAECTGVTYDDLSDCF